MKILVVNDDSIHAPGIALLAEAAAQLGEVYVVAPEKQCSAMSHRITLQGAMKVKKAAFPVPVAAAYSVDGTPADCVKVALYHILKEKPDIVFSGINDGFNAGYDIAYSGTLAAAFEARMNGIPAVAFSSAGRKPMDIARMYLPQIAKELVARPCPPGAVWNVNFPAVAPEDFRGILYDRTVAPVQMYLEQYIQIQNPDGSVAVESRGIPLPKDATLPLDSDVFAVRNGYISVGSVKNAVL